MTVPFTIMKNLSPKSPEMSFCAITVRNERLAFRVHLEIRLLEDLVNVLPLVLFFVDLAIADEVGEKWQSAQRFMEENLVSEGYVLGESFHFLEDNGENVLEYFFLVQATFVLRVEIPINQRLFPFFPDLSLQLRPRFPCAERFQAVVCELSCLSPFYSRRGCVFGDVKHRNRDRFLRGSGLRNIDPGRDFGQALKKAFRGLDQRRA